MQRPGSLRGWCGLALFTVLHGAGLSREAAGQWRMEVLPGARFGPPLRAGLAVGAVYGRRLPLAQFAGPMLLGEGGVGGGRLSAGYLLAFPFGSGVEILGSAIRTWGSPSQIDRKRTMVGGELRMSYFAVNVGLGVFRPTRTDVAVYGPRDGRRRYYLNVGLGL